jgi:hypothetical protein
MQAKGGIMPPVTEVLQRTRCSVCSSPYKAQIHALLAAKMPMRDIHAETQKMGRGYKRETIGKHLRICLNGIVPVVDAQAVYDASKEAKTQGEIDFATLVQRRAAQMLNDGQLRVTASHGIQAQALLDRRVEKAADRDLALNMARLLSGSIAMPPMTVIDSRAVDVTPMEIGDGLAPAGVYEPGDA